MTGTATGNGLFYGGGMTLLFAQLKGIGAVAVYTLAVSLASGSWSRWCSACASARPRRLEGLDIGEHGEAAYIIPEPRSSRSSSRSRRRPAVTAHPHTVAAPTGSSRPVGAACAGHACRRTPSPYFPHARRDAHPIEPAVVMLSGRRFVLGCAIRRRSAPAGRTHQPIPGMAAGGGGVRDHPRASSCSARSRTSCTRTPSPTECCW